MRYMILILAITMAGCTSVPKPKLFETDNPEGYTCKTHGSIERVYKVGVKYYCKPCVDENIGQVEMYMPEDRGDK